MGNLDYKTLTKRRRPHVQPLGGTLFVTFRLAGSIPKSVVREYEAKKRWLDDQMNRARRSIENDDAPEMRNWLLRVERFRREWFIRFEDILHRAETGPTWLSDHRLAETVANNLERFDDITYTLHAYSLMSNHVHTVFKPSTVDKQTGESFLDDSALCRIMHSIKGRSARECNLILGRTGRFWEQESFDHVIRPGRFAKTIRYVLNNPVKAGLVSDWREWRWNY